MGNMKACGIAFFDLHQDHFIQMKKNLYASCVYDGKYKRKTGDSDDEEEEEEGEIVKNKDMKLTIDSFID